jgi:hypothetical protein
MDSIVIEYGYKEINGEVLFTVDYTSFFGAHEIGDNDQVQYVLNRLKEEVNHNKKAILLKSYEDSKPIVKATYSKLREVERFEQNISEIKYKAL